MFQLAILLPALAAHLVSAAAEHVPETFNVAGRFSLPAVRAAAAEHDPSSSRVEAAATAGEIASIEVGSNWFIPVSIGTPPQSFFMLGDTGAPTLSVANTLEPKNLQGSNPLFNPNKSSTAHQIPGETYHIKFISGYSSSGPVFRDTFKVGDLVVDGMPIGLPNNHSASKADSGRSGNLGLDFAKHQSMHPTEEPTWLASVMPQLESQVFTVDWNKAAGNGTWDFGFIDKSKYSGSIAYGPVNSTNGGAGWTVKVTSGSNSMYATVDTGTGGSHVTPAIAKAYFANIQGATYDPSKHLWTYPCTSKLQDFKFSLGGTQVAIPANALAAGSVGNGRCQTTLQVGNADAKKLIWGRTFIVAMFVVFDWGNGQVGWANKS